MFWRAVCPERISAPAISLGSYPGASIWILYTEYGWLDSGSKLYSTGGAPNATVSLWPLESVVISSRTSSGLLISLIRMVAPEIGLESLWEVMFARK